MFQKNNFNQHFIRFQPTPMPLCDRPLPPLALPNWDRHTAIPWESKSAEENRNSWNSTRLADTGMIKGKSLSQAQSATRKLSRYAPWICCRHFCKSSVCPREVFSLGSLVTANAVMRLSQRVFPCFLNQQIWEDCSISTNREPESCNTNVAFFHIPKLPVGRFGRLGYDSSIKVQIVCSYLIWFHVQRCVGRFNTSSESVLPSDQIFAAQSCVMSTLATHFLMAWSRKTMNLTRCIVNHPSGVVDAKVNQFWCCTSCTSWCKWRHLGVSISSSC